MRTRASRLLSPVQHDLDAVACRLVHDRGVSTRAPAPISGRPHRWTCLSASHSAPCGSIVKVAGSIPRDSVRRWTFQPSSNDSAGEHRRVRPQLGARLALAGGDRGDDRRVEAAAEHHAREPRREPAPRPSARARPAAPRPARPAFRSWSPGSAAASSGAARRLGAQLDQPARGQSGHAVVQRAVRGARPISQPTGERGRVRVRAWPGAPRTGPSARLRTRVGRSRASRRAAPSRAGRRRADRAGSGRPTVRARTVRGAW